MAATDDTNLGAPFTDEQMEYLRKRDARISEHGTAWSRRHIRSYTRRASVGFLILFIGVAGAFYTGTKDASQASHAIVTSGRTVSVAGCNRDYVTVNRLRNVLKRSIDFQHAALARGDISQEQFNRAVVYFNTQLAGLPQVDCRPSATIITDDIDNLGTVPEPLHPPDKPYAGPH